MQEYAVPAALARLLPPWYRANRRSLPWREDRDAYHIWISEIMLQQTRVEAVKGYYARFLTELPDIRALAACDDERLHKLWEGLGYYSRVRNLKKAAQVVVEKYGGAFPETYDEILALPGIGEYTAGAICSIAYDLPTPAVDGNVLRVCARLTGDEASIDLPETKKRVRAALAAIYPKNAGEFTQSLMELGATLCGPNWKPRCDACPCRAICAGFQSGTAEALPVRSPKREKRQEDRTVFILSCGGRYALRKRDDKGLLAGLWEFPNVPGKLELPQALRVLEAMGITPRELGRQVERRHIFTHIQWNLRGFYLETADCTGGFQWFTKEEINAQAALPTAFRQFWEEIDHV